MESWRATHLLFSLTLLDCSSRLCTFTFSGNMPRPRYSWFVVSIASLIGYRYMFSYSPLIDCLISGFFVVMRLVNWLIDFVYIVRHVVWSTCVLQNTINQQVVTSSGAVFLIVISTNLLTESSEEAILYQGLVCCLATCFFCAAPLATLVSILDVVLIFRTSSLSPSAGFFSLCVEYFGLWMCD